MSSGNPLSAVKDGVSLAAEIIKLAADDPNAKEAAKNLGRTALTITDTINNVLLPLAVANFAITKARVYFEGKFKRKLSEKTASIPAERIVEPRASIVGPALQGLAFSHEEPNLEDMYLSLLATAMDGRVASDAHPAFVEIIKQLNSEEADLIRGILRSTWGAPIVSVRLTDVGSIVYRDLLPHMLNMGSASDQAPVEHSRLPAMVDNWIRLGLVEVDYEKHFDDDSLYSWVEGRPEIARLRTEKETDKRKVTYEKGCICRTQFGLQFATAVGLLSTAGNAV